MKSGYSRECESWGHLRFYPPWTFYFYHLKYPLLQMMGIFMHNYNFMLISDGGCYVSQLRICCIVITNDPQSSVASKHEGCFSGSCSTSITDCLQLFMLRARLRE